MQLLLRDEFSLHTFSVLMYCFQYDNLYITYMMQAFEVEF